MLRVVRDDRRRLVRRAGVFGRLAVEVLEARLALAAVANPDLYEGTTIPFSATEDTVFLATGTQVVIDDIVSRTSGDWRYFTDIMRTAPDNVYPTDANGRNWRAVDYDVEAPRRPGDLATAFGQWRGPSNQGFANGGVTDIPVGGANGVDVGAGYVGAAAVKTTFLTRRTFSVTQAQIDSGTLKLNYVCDDGCVFHINGQEVYRVNIGTDQVDVNEYAPGASANETFQAAPIDIPVAGLNLSTAIDGNVLAVEAHNAAPNSSDIGVRAQLFTTSSTTAAPSLFANDTPNPMPAGAVGRLLDNLGNPVTDTTVIAYDVDNPGIQAGVVTNFDPATGFFQFAPAANYTGTARFGYDVDDNTADAVPPSASAATIKVVAMNDAPIATTDDYSFSVVSGGSVAPGAPIIEPLSALWFYADDGQDQNAVNPEWKQGPTAGFNPSTGSESGWKQSPARDELGYGDTVDGRPEATRISFVDTDPVTAGIQRNITSYFWNTFDLPDGLPMRLAIDLLVDDGAAVYINGIEVRRNNLPTGAITATTLSSGGASETIYFRSTVDPVALGLNLQATGNTIAVEVHQQNAASADVSFSLGLSDPTKGLLANDIDVDDQPSALRVNSIDTSTLDPLRATVTVNPNNLGGFTFTPIQATAGDIFTFTYTTRDGDGVVSPSATVTITITPSVPVAVNDSYSTLVDTALTVIDAAQGLLGNDTDADEQTPLLALKVQEASIRITPAAAGVFALGNLVAGLSDGTFTFTPAAGFEGLVNVIYTIVDPTGLTSTATAVIRVGVTGDPPPLLTVAGNQTADEGAALVVSTLGTFTDVGGGPYRYEIDWGDGSAVDVGTPTVNSQGAEFHGQFGGSHTYADNGDYTVRVRVFDGAGGSDLEMFSVQVNNVAPTVDAGADLTVAVGTTVVRTGSFTDPGTDTHAAQVDYGDGAGYFPLAIQPGNTFTLTLLYDLPGTRTVRVKVMDDDGGETSDTLVVTVTAEPAITGVKFEDANGDGVQNANESGLPGWTIYLDANNNGQLDAGESSTTTIDDDPLTPTIDETGRYRFANVSPGEYVVREVGRSGWVQTAPAGGSHLASAFILDANATVTLDVTRAGDFNGPAAGIGTVPPEGVAVYGLSQSNPGTDYRWVYWPGDPAFPAVCDAPDNRQRLTGVTVSAAEFVDTLDANGRAQVRIELGEGVDDAGFVGLQFHVRPQGAPATTAVMLETPIPAQCPGESPLPLSVFQRGVDVSALASPGTRSYDFGNRDIAGDILGTVWNDQDGDGLFTGGEPVLPDWTVYLDANNNGVRDGADPTTTTNVNGVYAFRDLPQGSYRVRQVLPAGWRSTFPTPPAAHDIALSEGATIANVDFGNTRIPLIRGTVHNDIDGDGLIEAGEPPLAGRAVYLDANGNGQFDAGTHVAASTDVPRAIPDRGSITSTRTVAGLGGTVTDVDVTLTIDHTFNSDLRVFLIGPTGLRVELFSGVGGSARGFFSTTLDDEALVPLAAGSLPFTGRFRPEGVLGTFDGTLANGVWSLEVTDTQAQDVGTLLNWSLAIQTTAAGEPNTATDAAGAYVFNNLAAGNYRVCPLHPFGWTQTVPAAGACRVVTLAAGEVANSIDFASVFTTPPQVTGVRLGSTLGPAIDHAVSVGTGLLQLAPLPWPIVNIVRVTFNSEVVVHPLDLKISGVDVCKYDLTPGGFQFDPATRTATWQFQRPDSGPLVADRLLIELVSGPGTTGIHGLADNPLDGDWTNPTRFDATTSDAFPSGNGLAGGNFALRVNVLPGDVEHKVIAGVNQARQVSAHDFRAMLDRQFTRIGDALYDPFYDLNGDGTISIADLSLVQHHLGTLLPEGEPGGNCPGPSPAASPPESPAASSTPDLPLAAHRVPLAPVLRTSHRQPTPPPQAATVDHILTTSTPRRAFRSARGARSAPSEPV